MENGIYNVKTKEGINGKFAMQVVDGRMRPMLSTSAWGKGLEGFKWEPKGEFADMTDAHRDALIANGLSEFQEIAQ